ncbi:MAG: hypothetical protein CME60_00745 [Halobacteriovoraceae bacterium]|nr:hypothetical protein [Halobacteriovoraceae bacterium]|tara:strand:- start:519 stop:1352 length:834 start_codon:yes stop_codon:yes gene_type:complete
MSYSGTIRKMKGDLKSGGDPVQYHLPLRNIEEPDNLDKEILVPMNDFLGKEITLDYQESIYDIYDGKSIKKSYGQGFSYKNFISLARCDSCIVKPELCHYHKGTCREPKWGEEHCFIPHVIYLSITSGVKIGITRETQVPTRWIDQGAVYALPILKVADRKTSGMVEVELAKTMADKTNWRNMLKGEYEFVDLELIRDQIFEEYGDLLDDADADDIEEDILEIKYPILEIPKKFSSLSFDKKQKIEGTLLGIKGQYLILDTGVINMRKHQGYHITLS